MNQLAQIFHFSASEYLSTPVPWKTNIASSPNTRMLEQLALRTPIRGGSHDDRFPMPLWETWFCSSLGVPIPALLANPQQCPCRQFRFNPYGDHIQTCQRQSAALPSHEWIVHKLSLMFRSIGHRAPKDSKRRVFC